MKKKAYSYVTNNDVKFDHLEKFDLPELVDACQHKWFNQVLTRVNDSVVRLGIVEGEYHWHKHENEDEFFFVVSGQLFIDLENESILLHPNQGITVSRGVLHRTRAEKQAVILMVESSTIEPTGD
ncbi:MAG: cupin domain-containing protein [Rhodothermales bacterium]